MAIYCEIEQMTTQSNLETDYSSSDNITTNLRELSSSEEEEINTVRKELLDGILSPTKAKSHTVRTNENNKAPKELSIETKATI